MRGGAVWRLSFHPLSWDDQVYIWSWLHSPVSVSHPVGTSCHWSEPAVTLISWPDHLLYPSFSGFLRTCWQWLKYPQVVTQIIVGNIIPRWGVKAFEGQIGMGGLLTWVTVVMAPPKAYLPTVAVRTRSGLWEHSGLAALYGCVMMARDPEGLEEYIGETWLTLGDPWKQGTLRPLWMSQASTNQKGYQLWGLRGPRCVS